MPFDVHAVLELLEGGCSKLKVLVVGDVMLDRYLVGNVERISPEAPVPVLHYSSTENRAGGAANVALNLAGLGCQVALAGLWGDDAERVTLEELLRADRVDLRAMVTTPFQTISKTRLLGRNQQLLRLDIERKDTPRAEDLETLRATVTAMVAEMDAVILSDYAKGALSVAVCQSVIESARKKGIPVLADPKTKDLGKYHGATMVCPNLNEMSMATGVSAHHLDELLKAGEVERQTHALQYLCVTMSEKGIQVLYDGGSYHSPAKAREVFDVSGAGDTVIATLAAALAAGLAVETATDLANIAAGIVVGKIGTIPIHSSELVEMFTQSSTLMSREKVIPRERLAHLVADWRAAGHKIVFTNGCFDLLHVGHVTLLEDCRRFGTKLVVGLNTDASVQRLKGPMRPIVGEQERAIVMSALGSVDAVTLFDEDTPLELIALLKPDVLVKGGDYSIETVVGHELVLKSGGSVEIVPTLQGFSTTNIANKILAGLPAKK